MTIRGRTLIFYQIEVEDAGRYECLARNRYDRNVTAVAEVIVNGRYNSDSFISKPYSLWIIDQITELVFRVFNNDITIQRYLSSNYQPLSF